MCLTENDPVICFILVYHGEVYRTFMINIRKYFNLLAYYITYLDLERWRHTAAANNQYSLQLRESIKEEQKDSKERIQWE